jgi:hypothetical protein
MRPAAISSPYWRNTKIPTAASPLDRQRAELPEVLVRATLAHVAFWPNCEMRATSGYRGAADSITFIGFQVIRSVGNMRGLAREFLGTIWALGAG